MNVLILGSGAREHAIAWKVKQSKKIKSIFVLPGNPGILEQSLGKCIEGNPLDFDFVNKVCLENDINFIIVGPEAPLVNGVVDFFEINNSAIKVFGPNKKAAQLEGSKCFSKNTLDKYQIPTAKFKNFENESIVEIIKFVDELTRKDGFPVVIKADGLAGGKGVIIAENRNEASESIEEILNKKIFGDAGKKIVVEEFLKGYEVSLHLLVNENQYKLLPFSQDHKQVFDNDKGPNTGGMGAYSPCPLISDELQKKIETKIIKPFLNGLMKEDIKYKGVLYIGLMICNNEPFVLEFNVRLGDPETQVLLPLLDIDLLEIMEYIASDKKEEFEKFEMKIKNEFAIAITCASKGYPGKYENDKKININYSSLKNDSKLLIFHAGTKLGDNGILLTNGGRVLTFVAFDETLKKSIKKAYENIENVNFDGMHYRKDIGQRKCLEDFLNI